MLLDNITVETPDQLHDAIHTHLIGTCVHGNITITRDSLQDCHENIAATIQSQLPNVPAQDKWRLLLRILRYLPWSVDPENSLANTKEEMLNDLFFYFGGMEGSSLDSVYNQMRLLIESGGDWPTVLSIYRKLDKASHLRQPPS
jgi:hypothetical protein